MYENIVDYKKYKWLNKELNDNNTELFNDIHNEEVVIIQC